MQEAAVRPAVDDVERALEHAEERERRPEQERAADEAERGRVRLDRPDRAAGSSRATCSGTSRAARARRTSSRPPGRRGRAARATRKSSGTNESSAKYAIIAARWVPRSAKNFAHGRARTGARSMLRRRGRSPGARRPDGDLVAGRGTWPSIDADGAVTGLDARATSAAAERFADGVDAARRRGRRGARGARLSLAQLEAATLDGSVFVVRDGERMIAATTTPEPTVGLVFYDLKHCLRSIDEPAKPKPRAAARAEEDGGRCRRVGSSPGCCSPPARSPARCSYRRRAARQRERVDLYAEDGSMASFADGSPEARAPAPARARAAPRRDP